MTAEGKIARVLLPLPIDRAFDFLVPEELALEVSVGRRVRVRFRGGERWGIIAALAEESEHAGPLEEVVEVSSGPAFSEESLSFCSRIAEHYLAPPGLVVNRVLPRGVSGREERFFTLSGELGEVIAHLEALSRRAPRQAGLLRFLLAVPGPCSESKLREELGPIRKVLGRLLQKGLVQQVNRPEHAVCEAPGARPPWVSGLVERLLAEERILLFSQKRWEAYLHLIKATLTASRDALLLAPEILLARQLHAHLQKHLGRAVELYHSGLSEGERGRIWEDVHQGRVHLVVGTRSALFLPFSAPGLVIVDEEQDRAYKQDEMLPYYNARCVALKRGEKGLVLLGSFAPSLEAFHAAQAGELDLIRPVQIEEERTVRVVDMEGERGVLSEVLIAAIDRTLAAGERVLLGVNRRGYFQAVLCKECDRPLRCPRCGVNLTYQAKRAQLLCRLCGKAYERMVCLHCGSRSLRFVGVGCERVEEEVRSLFPRARVIRIDMDALRGHGLDGSIEELLSEGGDILVATPMIAKGPPLPQLGLAGAIGVDRLLALPDFRAAERTYQYLTALAGRIVAGEVVIQTHYPDHYAVRAAARGDYDRFYARESVERRKLFYPPFSHLARLILTGRSDAQRRADGKRISVIVRPFEVDLLGPSPHLTRRGCAVLLVKGKDAEEVRAACIAVQQEIPRVEIDLDPVRI